MVVSFLPWSATQRWDLRRVGYNLSVRGRRPKRIEDLDYRDRRTLYTTALGKLAQAQKDLAMILRSIERDNGDAPDQAGRDTLIRWHNTLHSLRAEMESKLGHSRTEGSG